MPKHTIPNRYHPEIWDYDLNAWVSLNENEGVADTPAAVKIIRAYAKAMTSPANFRVVGVSKLISVKENIKFSLVENKPAAPKEEPAKDPLDDAEPDTTPEEADQEVVDAALESVDQSHFDATVTLPLDTDAIPEMF